MVINMTLIQIKKKIRYHTLMHVKTKKNNYSRG